MNCTQDPSLQLAVALGHLWGMGSSSPYSSGSWGDRVEKTRIVLQVMGFSFPVQNLGPSEMDIAGVRVVKSPDGKAWHVFVSPDGKNPYSFNAYWSALACAVQTSLLRAALPAFDPPHPDFEDLQAWSARLSDRLKAGWPTHGITLKQLGKWFAVYLDDKINPISIEGDLQEAVRKALTITGHERVMNLESDYEPLLRLEDDNQTPLLDNPFFRAVYVDSSTAIALGRASTPESGWYIQRGSRISAGPFETPFQAVRWVYREWGEQVDQYALIAGLNDQYEQLRSRYDRELARLNQQGYSESKTRSYAKKLRKQFEFSLQAVTAPFLTGDVVEEDTVPPAKRFYLPAKQGGVIEAVVWFPSKKSKLPRWDAIHMYPNGGAAVVGSGEYGEAYYDTLLGAIKQLLVGGHIALPSIPAQEPVL